LGEEVLFDRHWDATWRWNKMPSVTNQPSNWGQSDIPMLGQFPSVQKIVTAYAALSTGIGYYHFPASSLDRVRQQHTYVQQKRLLDAIPGLTDDASNYLEIIRAMTQDFHRPDLRKNLLATLRTMNSTVASVELDSLTKPQRAIVAHNASGNVFELSLEQESDGFRRFYAHLLALYQTPPKLALVFEEPENAIFPGALSLLADEFKAAPSEKRGQVILTTHSPILLDSFDVNNVRAVDMQKGKTIVGRISKDQRDAVKERLLKTGDLLTVESPRLDEVEESILTRPS